MPVPALVVPVARCLAITVATFAVALLAACGQQQQGGFQMPPAQVTTVTLEPKTIPVSYEYVGQTTGSKEVEVRARVTGILEQKYFQEGAAVKQGQRLFVIDPKPLEAQAAAAEADLVRARAQKAQADREAARLKPLAERKAIGQKEADDAASNAEFASANVRSAEAKLREVQLNLSYTNVAAPITGLTSRAPKSEGSLVNANDTLLTTIWQVNPIWVPFAIPESDQLALQKEVAAGRLVAPQGQRLRRHGQADGRQRLPASGSHQLRRLARQSIDRFGRVPRRDPQRRRRAEARPVRAGQARRRKTQRTLSRCRRSRCWTARKASSCTSSTRTRMARTSPRYARSPLANGSTLPTRRTATCGSSRAASKPATA